MLLTNAEAINDKEMFSQAPCMVACALSAVASATTTLLLVTVADTHCVQST